MTAALVRAFAGPAGAQVHYRVTSGQEFTHPPVVMIHQAFHSGRVFEPVMRRLGTDRLVLAPDLIGHGDSDPMPEPPPVATYAATLRAWLQALALDRVDLVGYHLGSAIAVELARLDPVRIRQLVLIGVPAFNDRERQAAETYLASRSLAPREDGSQLIEEWQRSRLVPGLPLSAVAANLLDKLKAGERLTWGARAALGYPMLENLSQLPHTTTVFSPRDDLAEMSPRALSVLRDPSRFKTLDAYGFGLFDLAPDIIAALLRDALDATPSGAPQR